MQNPAGIVSEDYSGYTIHLGHRRQPFLICRKKPAALKHKNVNSCRAKNAPLWVPSARMEFVVLQLYLAYQFFILPIQSFWRMCTFFSPPCRAAWPAGRHTGLGNGWYPPRSRWNAGEFFQQEEFEIPSCFPGLPWQGFLRQSRFPCYCGSGGEAGRR